MTPRLEPIPLLSATLAGAALISAAHALLFPGLVGPAYLDGKLLFLLGNNLLAAALLALLALRWPGLVAGTRAGAFWAGSAVALAPMLLSWVYAIEPLARMTRARTEIWWVSEILPPVVGVIASLLFIRMLPRVLQFAPGRLICACLAAFAVGLAGVLFAKVGVVAEAVRIHELPAPPRERAALEAGPDVLLISVDTLRADAVTGEHIETPGIRGLQESGVASAYGLAPAPMTLPSHATMLSGRSPLRHGAWNNSSALPRDMPMAAEFFRKEGWRTAAIVSNGVLRVGSGIERGFEVYTNLGRKAEAFLPTRKIVRAGGRQGAWCGWLLPNDLADKVSNLFTSRRRADAKLHAAGEASISAETLRLSEQYLDGLIAGDSPYFLFVHFIDPHHPYKPPSRTAGQLIDAKAIPEDYRGIDAGSGELNEQLRQDLAAKRSGADEGVAFQWALYHEEVLYIDHCIEQILEKVRAGGRPTIILFTSDHGEHFGEHALMGHGNSVYEPLLRVPFLLSIPGESAPTLAHTPRLEDVTPTLMHLAGLPVPPIFDGHPLTEANPEPDYHWAWMPSHFALRMDGWKLLGKFRRFDDHYGEVEALALYDLSQDAAERTDLREQEAARVKTMLEQARTLLAEAIIGTEATLTEEDRQILEELGYVDNQ